MIVIQFFFCSDGDYVFRTEYVLSLHNRRKTGLGVIIERSGLDLRKYVFL